MPIDVFTFGEILWDCLPSGRHAGGAPFNVAAHLAQLHVPAGLISTVGQDALGDEILQVARDKNVDTSFVTRARIGLPTGTVIATLDAGNNATYELVQPVAWDEILVPARVLAAVGRARVLVFGSLAGRSLYNLGQLDKLLTVDGPKKLFDVNLRPPFVDAKLILSLAECADVMKLNDDELGQLAAYARTGAMKSNPPPNEDAIAGACATLARTTGVKSVCVTRGALGAAWWENGTLTCAPAPKVEVRDTVGAGDAFMAGVIAGLIRGTEIRLMLERACKLGGYVASHFGATPLLPGELVAELQ